MPTPNRNDDTQWITWEVFHQAKRGAAHTHVGSVHAPDAEMALLMAKEQFARRQACVNLWVVPAQAIYSTAYDDADMFIHGVDKSYREAFGYKVRRRIRQATESADDEITPDDEEDSHD